MGRWWPHRGTIIGWKGGRLWGIILARFRCANEETASSSIRRHLLYSCRTRAGGDWIWELGVGHGGAGHSPPCGQPPSVIAGGYCILDAVVSKAASFLPAGLLLARWLSRLHLGWLKE